MKTKEIVDLFLRGTSLDDLYVIYGVKDGERILREWIDEVQKQVAYLADPTTPRQMELAL